MIRLLVAQVRRSQAAFLGPFLTALVTAVFVQLAAVFWWSVTVDTGRQALAASGDPASAATFSTLGMFLLVLGVGLPAIIAFLSVGRNTVSLLRREYAAWRLAGVTPRQTVGAILTQTVLLVVPASLIALAVSVPASPAAVAFVMTLGSTRADLPVQVSWQPLLLSLVAAVVFALIGGLGPGIRAARTRAIEALRDAQVAPRSRTLARWVILALLVAAGVAVAFNIATASGCNGGASMLALVGILAAVFATAGPMIYPLIIRAWTLVLTPNIHPVVFLARRSSSADGTITAAVITPVLIAASLLSGYFSGAGTYKAAIELTGRGYDINLLQGIILFGPAAVIGVVAGLMGVLTRTSPDTRTATLLRIAGASPRTLTAVAAVETAIYAATTLLCTTVIVAIPTLLYAIEFRQSEGLNVPVVFDLRAALVLTVIASVVVFFIRVAPLFRRNAISAQLATT